MFFRSKATGAPTPIKLLELREDRTIGNYEYGAYRELRKDRTPGVYPKTEPYDYTKELR